MDSGSLASETNTLVPNLDLEIYQFYHKLYVHYWQ